jgi:hypothetical protein
MDNSISNANPLQKYFRQPKLYITLPSKGKFWPQGSIELTENNEYPVYAMTARDEIVIKTPDALLNGQTTVDVVQSCIPNIKNAWALPSLDLDALLIAIRIATYGETMDINFKTPVTGEEKTYTVDLRVLLGQLLEAEFDEQIETHGLKVYIRPLTYKETNETSMKTFEEQRIFRILNDKKVEESEKLARFNESFKKLTDLTVFTLEKSISRIVTPDGEIVNDPKHIKEFVNNSDKDFFKGITDKIDKERSKFNIKPMVVDATPEEIEKGVTETYEVPVTFNQSNFFA